MFFCEGDPTLLNTFDLTYLPSLLGYSFVPSALLIILLSLFIAIKDNFSAKSTTLLVLAGSYTLWTLANGLMWVTVPVNLNLFAWQVVALLEFAAQLSLLYFVLLFALGNTLSRYWHYLLAAVSLPVLILLPTRMNISSFDVTICEAVVEPLILYVHASGALFAIAIIGVIIKLLTLKAAEGKQMRNQKILVSTAAFVMLSFFTASNTFGELSKQYTLELIGPIGVVFFLILIAYIIVRYRAFNIKLAAAQALVVGIIALVGSQLFFVETLTNYTLVSLTLIFTIIGGHLLVRSVQREIKQREELQVLTGKLARANDRLKELDKLKSEFVSIASHQMRSPLTSMRGYASMILDGSYGAVPAKVNEVVQRIADSSAFMAKMIENYLNVSRIESGNMKYELSDFNLKLEVEKVVDDKRQEAIKKGLLLTFKSSLNGQGIVHADIGKTLEIIHNLLNNALKYTPKGSVDVLVHDDPKKKKIYVDIHDSGIGMTANDIAKLFGKFERAENANTVNITGTGLGLYVARTMAIAMKGEITASSEGQGQGSTFRFELPMMM